MEVAVTILESKNLSQSAIITRNLFTGLQVGAVVHRGKHVEQAEVLFEVPDGEAPLVVSVANGQTQTVLYERDVPLNVILERPGAVPFAFWVAVFPPGDQRNFATFDESARPRADLPQVHLQLTRTAGECLSAPLRIPPDEPRMSLGALPSPVSPGRARQLNESSPAQDAVARATALLASLGAGRTAPGVETDGPRESMGPRDSIRSDAPRPSLLRDLSPADRALVSPRRPMAQQQQRASTMMGGLKSLEEMNRPSITKDSTPRRMTMLDQKDLLALRVCDVQATEVRGGLAALKSQGVDLKSKEKEVQEAITAVEDARAAIKQAEADLSDEILKRAELDRDKQDAREHCVEARENIRLRDLALVELRQARDDAEERLEQLQVPGGNDGASEELGRLEADADSELQSLAAELERLRAEASGLESELTECDGRRQALEAESARDATITDDKDIPSDLRELQRDAEAAKAELEDVRQRAEEQAARVDGARAQSEAARQRLADAEAAADAAKRALAERETAAAEQEKMEHMARAAQLEGQVGENDNQLSEMQRQVQELEAHAKAKDNERQSLEETISGLRVEVENIEKGAAQTVHASTAADSLLQQITAEATERQSRLSALEMSRRADDLDHTQRVDEHDATAAAMDSELREAQREAMRLIDEQEKHKAEDQAAEAQSASCARQLEEARARALALEQELAVANVGRSRHEQHRAIEERRMGDLGTELQDALRKLESAEAEVSSARAVVAARRPARAAKDQQIEEQLRKIRTELELQLPKVEEAERRRTGTFEELEELRRQLPLRRERVKELMAEEQRLEEERQNLTHALDETRRCTGEQREARNKFQAKLTELQSHVGSAEEDASRSEKDQLERQRKHDEERRSWNERIHAGHGELEESRRATAGADEQLGLLRAKLAKVAEQQAAARSAVSDAAERLREAQAAAEGKVGASSDQLTAAEEDMARSEAEEAALKVRAAGLDAQLAQLEERCTKDLRGYRDLSSGFDGQRRKLVEVQAALEDCNGELLSHQNRCQASTASLASSQEQASIMQARAAELRQQLVSLQEAVNHAERLRSVLNAAKDTHEAGREAMQKDFEQKEAELDAVAKKEKADEDNRRDAEAEKRVQRIAELEAAVKALEEHLESVAAEKETVSSRLGEMAVDKVGDHVVAKLTGLQKELQAAEERRWQLEAKITTAEAKTGASEEVIRHCEREVADRLKQLQGAQAESDKLRQARDQQMQALDVEVAAAEKERAAVESQVAQLTAEVAEAKEGRDADQGQLKDREQRCEEEGNNIAKTHLDFTVAEAERQVTLDQSSRLEAESEEMANMEDEELETKMKLLSEQLVSRREALAGASDDSTAADDPVSEAELQQCRAQLQTDTDRLAVQVEHGNIHFATSKTLEEEIRTLEGESDVLTLGFHDVEQQNEYLEKENLLMKQQVEGAYTGTQQDWATEVQRLKVTAEGKRHQDELDHWKQQAEELDREARSGASAMAHPQEESPETVALRKKLDAATAELALQEAQLKALGSVEFSNSDTSGSVHSVPAALHGLVAPAIPLPGRALRRKALLVACSYADTHAPLRGCGNDAWNMQCLLRHSLQYTEEQVRCLVGDSEFCPSPPQRRPTRENILTGFEWLTSGAVPGDNLLVFFCGYGTQQPQSVRGLPEGREPLLESHFVPEDFAEDLPAGFLSEPGLPCSPPRPGTTGTRYRLVPLVALRNSLARVPSGCKVTLVLDCGFSVVPGIGPHAAPAAYPRARDPRREAVAPLGRIPFVSQPREIDLPFLPTVATPVFPGKLACLVHSYSACQSRQWCAELPIEGVVQGAFTWAFVKALTHGHLCSTVRQHMRAMDKILADLQHYFRWIDQTPVLQLSDSAGADDVVLVSP